MRTPLTFSGGFHVLLAALAVTSCKRAPLATVGSDSGTQSGSNGSGPVACDDGTMNLDCCPDGVVSGGACNDRELSDCWTRCSSGFHGHFSCSGSRWTAGHGLFPCSIDAAAGDPPPDGPSNADASCKCPPTIDSSGDEILALPLNPPAAPTFALSDTCIAFLAPGGVAVRTSTPEACTVQVTLANGEVLTSTVTFAPRPACCTSGLSVAAASPFRASNIGPRDASPESESEDRFFEEWWYPECGTQANNCPATCTPARLIAAPAVCGPYETYTVGCVPVMVTAGWFCLMRKSDGEIIFTEDPPSSRAGFEMCPSQIQSNAPGIPPTCPDASFP
jgi:hypothetical protein